MHFAWAGRSGREDPRPPGPVFFWWVNVRACARVCVSLPMSKWDRLRNLTKSLQKKDGLQLVRPPRTSPVFSAESNEMFVLKWRWRVVLLHHLKLWLTWTKVLSLDFSQKDNDGQKSLKNISSDGIWVQLQSQITALHFHSLDVEGTNIKRAVSVCADTLSSKVYKVSQMRKVSL